MVDLLGREELDRVTAAELLPSLEWAALLFQASVVATSAAVDPYPAGSRAVVAVLLVAHLALLPVYVRGRGPFARGGRWIGLPLAQSAVVTAALAVLSTPGTYGHALMVPGSGYSNGFWVLLSGYPWPRSRTTQRWRVAIEGAGLAAFGVYVLVLCVLVNHRFELVDLRSSALNLGWMVTGYAMGKAGFSLTRRAASRQAESQRRNYTEFFDFLHSHVKASVAAIRMDVGSGTPEVLARIDELGTTISDYRVQLLLAQDRVALATLISESVRIVSGPLDVRATPRVGSVTVDRRRGVLVGHAVADLLKNCLEHGATAAEIACTIAGTDPGPELELVVSDDGPGFSPEVFDDPSRSLHRLRADARELGGDVELLPGDGSLGARVRLTVSLQDGR